MGKFYDHIPEDLMKWIQKQEMFCIASAPLSGDGHVNVSPKGVHNTFHIIDKNTVWYEDLTGSGIETLAHIRENGRITVLFNAFEGAPKIARLFGTGTVHEFGTPEYDALIPPKDRKMGSRCAVVIDVHKVGTSCGYSVPFYTFVAHRDTLTKWTAPREARDQEYAAANPSSQTGNTPSHAEKGLIAYWKKENMQSIDGLPAMRVAPTSGVVPVTRDAKNGTLVQAKMAEKVSGVAMGEYVRLVAMFVLGLLVAGMYPKFTGGMGDRIGAKVF